MLGNLVNTAQQAETTTKCQSADHEKKRKKLIIRVVHNFFGQTIVRVSDIGQKPIVCAQPCMCFSNGYEPQTIRIRVSKNTCIIFPVTLLMLSSALLIASFHSSALAKLVKAHADNVRCAVGLLGFQHARPKAERIMGRQHH